MVWEGAGGDPGPYPITELKDALQHGRDLRGHAPPQPIVRGAGSNGAQMLFLLGDVMDVAELMANS